MYKKIMNLLLELEKKNGKIFYFILACNEIYFKIYFFFVRQKKLLNNYQARFFVKENKYTFKLLCLDNLNELYNFLKSSVNTNAPEFFMPHKTDRGTLKSIFNKKSHIALGIYSGEKLIGYSLIRLLFPRKASYAILVADAWQGKGIGTAALAEQLNLIKELGFNPYSAVSKKNTKSLKMLKKLGVTFENDLGDYFVVKDRKKE